MGRRVCELQDDLDAARSRLTLHLKRLKEAGVVSDRRESRWVYYSLVPDARGTRFELLRRIDVRYALVSDVHGNLPALEAVLREFDGRTDVDAVYHLGDLVGYAPWPNEVVALLRDRAIPGVAGNYDSTTATDYEHCGCRYEDPRQEELSHLSYEWTRANVTPQTRAWLGGLPFRIDVRPLGGHTSGPRLMLVHGNPVLNTVYWTEDRSDAFCTQMAERLGARAGDVVAFGHTHKPWHRVVEDIHIVNTGSVGRPKDGDWRAGYVVVEMDGETVDVEVVRVDYDLDRTTAAIRESELPDDFAEYLESGGMPEGKVKDGGDAG